MMINIKINGDAIAKAATFGASALMAGIPIWLVVRELKASKKLKAYKTDRFNELGFNANEKIAEASIKNIWITNPADKAFLKVSLDSLYSEVVNAVSTKRFEEALETFLEYTDFLTHSEEDAKTYLEYLRLLEKKTVIEEEHKFELDKIGAATRPLVDALAYRIKWS